MAANSKIEWTHHTFNPWRGCTKVSAGCAHCYAETMSKRNPAVLGIWGDKGTRVIASESMWREPIKWNAAAAKAGEGHRVFCASLADVCEDRNELIEPRIRLKRLIEATPNLDWLLLTKRPENYPCLFYEPGRWPDNVWAGTSVEDQPNADKRIPALLKCGARVLFLSCEPLLGPIVLPDSFLLPDFADDDPRATRRWAIVGGESGPHARPMHPDWARSIRDQCVAAGVPFFFKQWGAWKERRLVCEIRDGEGQPSVNDSRWHRWPDGAWMSRIGKKSAGRALDGRTWDEFPARQEFTR